MTTKLAKLLTLARRFRTQTLKLSLASYYGFLSSQTLAELSVPCIVDNKANIGTQFHILKQTILQILYANSVKLETTNGTLRKSCTNIKEVFP